MEEFKLPNKLEEKFVAFIDVLGFSELVFKNNTTQLENYFSALIETLNEPGDTANIIDSISISDSIILIAPKGRNGLLKLVKQVRAIQRKMMLKGILLRGAISYGEVYFNDKHNIIVGKGYIRAYSLEKEAIYPRVIIDPSIVKVVDTDGSGSDRTDLVKLLNKGCEIFQDELVYSGSKNCIIPNDGIFINYLYALTTNGKISISIRGIYKTISENLYSEQKLFQKYDWLRNYYLECLMNTQEVTSDPRRKRIINDWIIKFKRL